MKHSMNLFSKSLLQNSSALIVLAITVMSGVLVRMNASAEVPTKAVISKIYGQKELWIRRRGKPTPAQIDAVLEKYYDSLLVNGNSKTHAILKFYSASDRYLDLFVKTIIHSTSAIYYFPCTIQSGSYLFGWGLATKLGRGCERAIQIRGGNLQALVPESPFPKFAQLNQSVMIAQGFSRQVNYCSVASSSGQSWMDISSGDPCTKPTEKCTKSTPKGLCTTLILSYWWTTEPKLKVSVECAQNRLFTADGTGNNRFFRKEYDNVVGYTF